MIRGFWQSRLTACGIFALTAGMAVYVWVRDLGAGMPVYIPLLASVLLLALGYAAGRLAGNLTASHLNAKALALLHVQLDPAAFLASYAAVPGRLRGAQHAIASAYLADGYAAAGEYDKAVATLCPDFAGKSLTGTRGEELSLKGLYYNNLAAYELGREDPRAAGAALDELEKVIGQSRQDKPAFADNMANNLRLYRSWQACLEGRKAESEWLAAELPKATYNLRRLEILRVLAMDALRRDRLGRAREYLEEMQSKAGKTCYRTWAEEALNNLPERQ